MPSEKSDVFSKLRRNRRGNAGLEACGVVQIIVLQRTLRALNITREGDEIRMRIILPFSRRAAERFVLAPHPASFQIINFMNRCFPRGEETVRHNGEEQPLSMECD